MTDQLLVSIIGAAIGAFLLWLWLRDLKTNQAAETGEASQTLPGAFPASLGACIIATAGAVILVIGFSIVERMTGIDQQQSTIPYYYLLAMLGAAVTEEIVFRGYLIVRTRGRFILFASALLFSLIFASLHPYLWLHVVESPSGIEWITTLRLHPSMYAVVSTVSIALLSLWYYYVRFFGANPSRSLLPCFCAHASANLSVFIIKLATDRITLH